jgi:hypothetical protein
MTDHTTDKKNMHHIEIRTLKVILYHVLDFVQILPRAEILPVPKAISDNMLAILVHTYRGS